MSELKELAGMNDVSEADEDETELLSKEAEMPLEQLLSKLKQQVRKPLILSNIFYVIV